MRGRGNIKMNIDLHSHFFPVEALQNPGKFENRAPKLVLNDGKLSVTSQLGLGAGAYDPAARKVMELKISDTERELILGVNAKKALQL